MTKEQVIRQFLAFVSRFVPLKQAQLATMGGKGLEAKIWAEQGVPLSHGWLIERSAKHTARLIESHRFRTHNQLGTFHRILSGLEESKSFVDGFHLDLCGTLSVSALRNFSPVLPLVLKSTGRCLAVTVADARRNVTLEEWPACQTWAKRLFGVRASQKIYADIVSQQERLPIRTDLPAFFASFDAVKAAKREFGLLVSLAMLLRSQGFGWVPVEMERYIYVSRYSGKPFRMRTYFFRFGRSTSTPENTLADIWLSSKLFFTRNGEFGEIVHQPPMRGTTMSVQNSKLHDMAKVFGGEAYDEYKRLLSDSERLQTIMTAIQASNGVVAPVSLVQASDGRKRGRPPGSKSRRKWEDLEEREQVEWLIKVLELKSANGGPLKNGEWKDLLKTDFGHYSEALGRSLRSAMARTSGNFRKKFTKRIGKIFGDEAPAYITRLDRL